jgi:hypothetical protein
MKISKKTQIKNMLEPIKVGQSFNKKEFIISLWGASDYFIDRSFDVLFNNAKKELDGREFKTLKGFIIRTK